MPIYRFHIFVRVDDIQLASGHLNLEDCIEESKNVESKLENLEGRSFITFSCTGESAEGLYHTIAYSQNSRLMGRHDIKRHVGLMLEFNVVSTENDSTVLCQSDYRDIIRGVIDRTYECRVSVPVSSDSMVINGTYNNKVINGDYLDHKIFLERKVQKVNPILQVNPDNGDSPGVEASDANIFCQTLSENYRKSKLEYQCAANSETTTYLIYEPRI